MRSKNAIPRPLDSGGELGVLVALGCCALHFVEAVLRIEAGLDALRQRDLLLCIEQCDLTDLLEVCAYGVGRCSQLGIFAGLAQRRRLLDVPDRRGIFFLFVVIIVLFVTVVLIVLIVLIVEAFIEVVVDVFGELVIKVRVVREIRIVVLIVAVFGVIYVVEQRVGAQLFFIDLGLLSVRRRRFLACGLLCRLTSGLLRRLLARSLLCGLLRGLFRRLLARGLLGCLFRSFLCSRCRGVARPVACSAVGRCLCCIVDAVIA